MAVYAISDIHLASVRNKPMDIFGGNWNDYMTKIKEYWLKTIDEKDTVIIPGDVSWAMYLDEAYDDFMFLQDLPGRKIISKGNHDYWWTTVKKLNQFTQANGFDSIAFLYNNGYLVEGLAIYGARGWKCPADDGFDSEDEKIYIRELNRLEISLNSVSPSNAEKVVVALHFMPFSSRHEPSGFVDILKKYGVNMCIYGHLHGSGTGNAVTGIVDGIEYLLVSADYLDFKPVKIS